MIRFTQCTKPYDVFRYHVNNVIDLCTWNAWHNWRCNPIARHHKIAVPNFSYTHFESGAQTLVEYNKLIVAGFESTYDRDEYREMWEVVEGMLPHRTASLNGCLQAKDGKIITTFGKKLDSKTSSYCDSRLPGISGQTV